MLDNHKCSQDTMQDYSPDVIPKDAGKREKMHFHNVIIHVTVFAYGQSVEDLRYSNVQRVEPTKVNNFQNKEIYYCK